MRKTRRVRRRRERSLRTRALPLVLVAFLISAAVYAFTATINVGGSFQAGSGNATPSTPSVTNMQFTYDSAKPTLVTSAALTFSASVTAVNAQLGGSWTSCSGSGASWTCTWSGVAISAISSNTAFTVVAT